MKKRRWIDVERAGDYIYWDCPFWKCSEPHAIDFRHRKIWGFTNKCGACKKSYKVEQLVGTRLLIEET